MSATFDANASADSTANGVTAINHANLTVGSGSNRALTAQIDWSGAVSAVTLTWDNGGTNQAMALVPSATATNTSQSDIWGLVNPISGNKTLRAAWTTARDVCLNGVSWSDVNQTGGATSFPNGTGATGSSATAAVTVTSAVGDAVIATHGSASDAFSSVNNTQTFLDNAPANHSACGNRAAGAASVVMNAPKNVSSSWESAGCSIKAAVAASDTQEWRGCYPQAQIRRDVNISY